MSWIVIISIIFFGLLFVLLEIFILPGLISGIVGGLLVIFGIVKSYTEYGSTAGHLTLLATIIIFALIMIVFFKTKALDKISLLDVIDGKVNTLDSELKVGDIGKTISRVSPMGKAIINGEQYEVSTNGGFINEKTEIIVYKIDGNKIFIKETTEK